ncbi:prepilin-type N-terminal cleavage/methylation domain-containing protein [Marinicella rhabdoformis]|uniref:prepilin-type N-terminal cleavage/methylation domain-containing protein n=1 Tax=Marinicella rhabdoformis TaxID=2580566 RepID=UPI0015D00FEE
MVNQKQQGFTLIEVIVVFTLLAMIMAMIFSGLDSGRRTAEKGEKRISAINEMRVVQGIIRRQVSRAMAIGIEEDDEGQMALFYGDENSVTFISQMPGYLGNAGPHIQKIEIAEDGDGKYLQYRHGMVSNYDDEDEQSGFDDAEPIVLMENIRSGQFAFIEVGEDGLPTDWVSEIENTASMPMMVQLDLEMNQDAKEQWPIMQVAIQVDGSSTRTRRRSSLNLLNQRSNSGKELQ